jgi:hypothetical protein
MQAAHHNPTLLHVACCCSIVGLPACHRAGFEMREDMRVLEMDHRFCCFASLMTCATHLSYSHISSPIPSAYASLPACETSRPRIWSGFERVRTWGARNGPQDFCCFAFILISDVHPHLSYSHIRSPIPSAYAVLPVKRPGRVSGLGLRRVRT